METTLIDQVQPDLQASEQTFASRVAFRFCFIYFGAYCLTTQIITSLIPLPNVDIPDPSTFWPVRSIILWSAAHIFRISQPLVYTGSGSGDKTFDWVLLFLLLVFATVGTAVWTALDRKRPDYATLEKWFRVFIRFCLAGQMITYGMDKAVPLQMPFPYLTRLIEHYGDFSPMGVLLSSIGASPSYETFAGCAELLGGILLIFPRTTTLGALICLADMTQVFMLNMTYDVPVKLLSFHLILLSLYLLAPEVKRLMNFFFLNRSAEPSVLPSLFEGVRANRVAFALQVALGVWLLGMNAYAARQSWHQYGGGRTLSPLYGIWDVEQQTIDGQPRPPLLSDPGRWRRAIFDFPERATFQRLDDSFARHGATIDVKTKTFVLSDDGDKNWKASFTFDRPTPDQMTLDGNMDGHVVHMQLKLEDRNHFLLVSRGFHWVQEYPYNR